MMKIELLNVKYHDQLVGTLSLTPDNKLCAFEYAPSWLADGFSISPLELPLRPGLFLAKPSPFFGNFGIFEDSEEGHWLVKFRHTYDPKDMGQQEYHYNEVARQCGFNVEQAQEEPGISPDESQLWHTSG